MPWMLFDDESMLTSTEDCLLRNV